MKKIIYYLVLLTMVGTFAFSLSSCGKDEPKKDPQVVNPDPDKPDPDEPEEPVVAFSEENPLMYVAKFCVNKRGNGFVKNHDLPSTKVVADIDGADIGYYNFEEAKGLFTGSHPFLENYYLPSKEQWQSIVPYGKGTNYLYLSKAKDQFTVKEKAQVGETEAKEYESDYIVVKEGEGFVAYALRFKGTKWLSAWRYTLQTEGDLNKMQVQCIGLKQTSTIKLEDIAKASFFTEHQDKVTERIFVPYGLTTGEDKVASFARAGLFSTSTLSATLNMFSLIVTKSKACIGLTADDKGLAVLPFKKDPKKPIPADDPIAFKNPLDFVAEYDVNKAGTGFVKNHNLPSKKVSEHKPTDVGYYRFEEAKALFTQKAWLKGYLLPSRLQWQAIVPQGIVFRSATNEQIIIFDKTQDKSTVTEQAQIGQTNIKEYSSDYITVKEGDLFVTYALKFKGTKWLSAWRYTLEGAENNKRMIIQCLALPAGSKKTLSDIANKSFFTNKANITKRIFPAYSIGSNDGEINDLGKFGYYTTSSLDEDNKRMVRIVTISYKYGAFVGGGDQFLIAVRPFVKQP